MKAFSLFLIALATGAAVWLEFRMAHNPSEDIATAEPAKIGSNPQPIDESERAWSLAQARTLTLNAETVSSRDEKVEASEISWPSFDQVIAAQTRLGLLTPPAGEAILRENAAHDPSIRLRVGYIYQPKNGVPFSVIINNKVDRAVRQTGNPAENALREIGLSDPSTKRDAFSNL